MIVQIYQPSTGYSSCPSAVLGDFSGKIGLSDEYIVYEAGDGWRLITHDIISGNVEAYRADIIQYPYNQYGYRSYYEINEVSAPEWADITVYAPAYVRSNIGYGEPLNLPIYHATIAYCSMILCAIMIIAIIFPRLWWRRKKGW